jgi:hypothetical protein
VTLLGRSGTTVTAIKLGARMKRRRRRMRRMRMTATRGGERVVRIG